MKSAHLVFETMTSSDASVQVDSGIDILDVGHGTIVVPRAADGYYGTCPNCGGSGNVEVECNPCGGTGRNHRGETCEWCRGHGKKAIRCSRCNGSGRVFVPDNMGPGR